MNKVIIAIILTLGLILNAEASESKPISEYQIKRLDRTMTKNKAHRRTFRTKKEFNHLNRREKHHIISKRFNYYPNNRYENGYNYKRAVNHHKRYREYGYSHSNRGWILAYRYDRASFYDDEGFFYGYFNRYGYYFEDKFYRYDRYYTYNDRVKGRGLFNHRYFMPKNANYYGFTKRVN